MRWRGIAFAAPMVALLGLWGCGDDGADTGAGGAAPTSAGVGGSQQRDGDAKVVRYDYAFDLTSAEASAQLTALADKAAECFAFDAQIGVGDVAIDDVAALVSHEDGVLRACGPTVNDAFTMTGSMQVPEQTFLDLDVGFSRKINKAGGTFSYLLSWVGGCLHFGPCDSDPAGFAEFHFDVTHPAGVTVLCPGALTAGETQTRCDLSGTLAPTYSAFAIAADAQWERQPFLSAAGVDLVFYEVPGGGLANGLVPADVTQFMNWVTELLGAYPFGTELRVAGGPTRWLGFEHPGNIILQENLDTLNSSYANSLMHVFMHEVVHQWAGDRTTLATTTDFVWKEAIAEYLPYVFEDTYGVAGEAAESRAYWDGVSSQSAHYPKPLDKPTPPVESFYGDVYGPGPMVLFIQLEPLIGRAAVLSGIQLFLSQQAALGVEDLQAALEQASGQELDAYFDAWVYGSGAPGWPGFMVSTEQVGDQVTVTLTQTSEVSHGCVVEVDVSSASETQTATIDFGLAPASKTAEVTVTLAGPVVSTAVDPRHRVIGGNANTAAAQSLPVWIF